MMAPVYILLCAVLLLMTFGRVVFRAAPKGIDWALEVAFIRLDFPPAQRVVAQQLAAGLAEIVGMKIKQLAAGLAEIVGMKIKQLRPEHNLSQIAEWTDNHIYAKDLITLFVVAFSVRCDPNTTFRDLVEKVAVKKAEHGRLVAEGDSGG